MDCLKQDYWRKSSWNKDSQSTGTRKANGPGCGSITHDPSLSASLLMTLGSNAKDKKMHNTYTTSSWKHTKSLQTGQEENILDLSCNGIIPTRKSICQCQGMSKEHSHNSTMNGQENNSINHIHMCPQTMAKKYNMHHRQTRPRSSTNTKQNLSKRRQEHSSIGHKPSIAQC